MRAEGAAERNDVILHHHHARFLTYDHDGLRALMS